MWSLHEDPHSQLRDWTIALFTASDCPTVIALGRAYWNSRRQIAFALITPKSPASWLYSRVLVQLTGGLARRNSIWTRTAFNRTYPQALDWISETGYLLRQTISPVALAGEECFNFPRDLIHRLMIRLARQANLLYADGFSIDPYRCWK